MSVKRVVIAGTGSGVGKTTIATGLMALLSKKYRVQSFKVGPDYIDPQYHAAATGRPSRNLDSFLLDHTTLLNLFGWASQDADIAIVEGVRGLYDGLTATGDTGSTAEVAKLLGAPVILVVNARSLAKSAAAQVLGFKMLDPDVRVAGVILNQVGGERHRQKAVGAVESLTGTEVIGVIERQMDRLPERHLGLVTMDERDDWLPLLKKMGQMVENVDLERLLALSETAGEQEFSTVSPFPQRENLGVHIAVPRDRAFSFYYPENLEALEAAGADLRFFRPTDGEPIPDADAVYIGGGYPELYADRIAENERFLGGLRMLSEESRTVYGECGGMMVLCKSIRVEGHETRMTGIFSCTAELTRERQGVAYVEATGTPNNFLFPDQHIRGHEFHYSRIYPLPPGPYGYEVVRGTGMGNGVDGLMIRKTMGTYMHQHGLSNRRWGLSFVDSCVSRS